MRNLLPATSWFVTAGDLRPHGLIAGGSSRRPSSANTPWPRSVFTLTREPSAGGHARIGNHFERHAHVCRIDGAVHRGLFGKRSGADRISVDAVSDLDHHRGCHPDHGKRRDGIVWRRGFRAKESLTEIEPTPGDKEVFRINEGERGSDTLSGPARPGPGNRPRWLCSTLATGTGWFGLVRGAPRPLAPAAPGASWH